MADLEKIMEDLSALTVVEAADLVKKLEDKWDVKAASGGGMMMAMPADAAEEKEEQTEFTVMLTGFGGNKIAVIKEVRAITGLGLKEAKGLVDGVPNAVKEDIPKDEADKIVEQLEKAGATAEIK